MSENKSKLFNEEAINRIKDQKQRWWDEKVKNSVTDEKYFTDSGIPLDLLYTPEHIADIDYLEDIGYSGKLLCERGLPGYVSRTSIYCKANSWLWNARRYKSTF